MARSVRVNHLLLALIFSGVRRLLSHRRFIGKERKERRRKLFLCKKILLPLLVILFYFQKMNTTLPASSTNSYTFRFEHYLLIWLSAPVSVIFACLSLRRYVQSNYQRTHFTYVYHVSLGFSLLLSFFTVPLHTFAGYFWSDLIVTSNQRQQLLCNITLITLFVASAGIGYSLAYASVERIFLIFYSHSIRLTWRRQSAPFLLIFSVSSIVITLVILLIKCPSDCPSCLFCCFESVANHFIWLVLQFLVPVLVMLVAISFFIYRIETHTRRIRTSISRRRSRKRFQRILLHLNLYNIYYLLTIGPLHIYVFVRIQMNWRQRFAEVFFMNYTFLLLLCYPSLMFVLERVKQKHRIEYHQGQKQSPYIIVTYPSTQLDEYDRTRL